MCWLLCESACIQMAGIPARIMCVSTVQLNEMHSKGPGWEIYIHQWVRVWRVIIPCSHFYCFPNVVLTWIMFSIAKYISFNEDPQFFYPINIWKVWTNLVNLLFLKPFFSFGNVRNSQSCRIWWNIFLHNCLRWFKVSWLWQVPLKTKCPNV